MITLLFFCSRQSVHIFVMWQKIVESFQRWLRKTWNEAIINCLKTLFSKFVWCILLQDYPSQLENNIWKEGRWNVGCNRNVTTKCKYRYIYETSEHPSESCRASFEEIKTDGMAITRNADFVFYSMKFNRNNVKHDITDRLGTHELNECVRKTFLCVL
jgi:hypothetical protein